MRKFNLLMMSAILSVFLIMGTLIGCGGSSGDDDDDCCEPPEPTYTVLQVDFTGAEALFLLDEETEESDLTKALSVEEVSSTTNLRIINESGEITTPFSLVSETGTVTSGVAVENLSDVGRTLFAPDGSIYLVFEEPLTMVEGGNCILARVVSGNQFECVDHELAHVYWPPVNFLELFQQPGIQFDGEGNIYYFGYIEEEDESTTDVLRKRSTDGEITELLASGVNLYEFLVDSQGFVYMNGFDVPNNQSFFRRLAPDGSLLNLLVDESAWYFDMFPDGNIYYGQWTDILSANLWKLEISGTEVVHTPVAEEEYDSSAVSWVDYLVKSINNNVYVSTSRDLQPHMVYRVYPEFERIDTGLKAVKIIKQYFNNLVVTGTDESGTNKLLLMQIDSDGPTIDLLPDENIEVFHIGADGTGLIYIDGLDYETNRYIVGNVDTGNDNSFRELTETTSRVLDFVFKN